MGPPPPLFVQPESWGEGGKTRRVGLAAMG